MERSIFRIFRLEFAEQGRLVDDCTKLGTPVIGSSKGSSVNILPAVQLYCTSGCGCRQ
jgi:hypothetical protein